MRINLLLVIQLLIFIASCKTTKVTSASTSSSNQIDTIQLSSKGSSKLVSELTSANIPYSTLACSGKGYIEINGEKYNITATFRNKYDTALWALVQATLLQVEAARLYATSDSIFILLKQEKTLQKTSYQELSDYIKTPVSLNTLQDIITGNFSESLQNKNYQFTVDSNNMTLNLRVTNTTDSTTIQYIFSEKTKKVIQIYVHNPSENVSGSILFSDFLFTENKQLFARNRSITITKNNIIYSLEFNFTNIEFNKELSMPFVVPNGYKIK